MRRWRPEQRELSPHIEGDISMKNQIALALVFAAGLLATPAFAQSQQEQQLCMDDAFKVCGHTIPDRNRTIACMVQNKSRLSSGCQMVMNKYSTPASSQTASAAPAPAPAPRMTVRSARMATPAKPVRTAANNGRPGKPLNILMR
jgi:hypothetical protein